MSAVVHVQVYQCAPGKRGSRGQRWRWRARAANNRIIATAGEAFTNESDCLASVELIFGGDTLVIRQHPSIPDVTLRDASGEAPE